MKLMAALILIQMVGIVAAVVAAIVEIETILTTGPVLSVIGCVIVFGCFRKSHSLGLYFGFSVPSISILCFSMIYGMKWGPGDAATPIHCLLIVFAVVSVPLGVLAVRRMPHVTHAKRPLKMQFSLADLLGLMLIVSLPFGLNQTLGEPGLAVGLLTSYLVVLVYCLKRFHRARADTQADSPCLGSTKPDMMVP
jgi:hypothetical protein